MSEAAYPALLLVEDSETQALQLRLTLEREGFRVERVASAEAALDTLNRRLPDLMVVDYRLPGMNGDELARQVRMNGRTRTLPILMFTEEAARELERQGLDSGANAYMPKSVDNALLVARLRALLRQRRPEGERAADAAAFRRARIAVAEPSATYRLFLASLLEAEGYAVRPVADVADVVAILDGEGLDCVVIGLDASGGRGLEQVHALDQRREASGETFEIVGLGGDVAGGEVVMAGFGAGADDVLPRVSDRDLLLARIRAVIRRKFARDEEGAASARERARERALVIAQAEAAAADALAEANAELEQANARLRDTQTQLVQAAKMASLGELVAGIAHEINNPLAFILAHQATVSRLVAQAADAPEDAPARLARAGERLDSMRGGLLRIQELVVKLRRFSRLDSGSVAEIDVPRAIEGVLALLAPKLGDGIAVELAFEAPQTLSCTPALIDQVVMNIVANAADVLGAEGRIRIATRIDADGRYRIEIGDNGPGIPAALRERIFEPFFTTKEVGQGTGLGLAIAYGVVRSHGGDIQIGESTDGGALFSISVPQTQAA